MAHRGHMPHRKALCRVCVVYCPRSSSSSRAHGRPGLIPECANHGCCSSRLQHSRHSRHCSTYRRRSRLCHLYNSPMAVPWGRLRKCRCPWLSNSSNRNSRSRLVQAQLNSSLMANVGDCCPTIDRGRNSSRRQVPSRRLLNKLSQLPLHDYQCPQISISRIRPDLV